MKRAALLLLAVVTSACSTIPSSGPIVQGQRVDVLRNDGYVRGIARTPATGMTPEALVRGFLEASASVADGDETARLYLTPEASRAWNPERLTVVYDSAALTISTTRGDAVQISAPKIGTIDTRHRYISADVGSTVTDLLKLRQVDGQWRIDTPPQALYLGEGDVARSFRAHPVFFFDSRFERLVPEFVLLSVGGGGLATQLMRTLLRGPSAQLESTLATAIPSGTKLTFGSISVDGYLATVPLSQNVLATSLQDRDRMTAQIVWTLSSLNDVVLVRITSQGQLLEVPSGRTSHSIGDYASVGPEDVQESNSLVYVRSDRLLALTNGERRATDTGYPISSAALSRDGTSRAFVLDDRKLLYVSRNGNAFAPVAAGQDLARPMFLPNGELWYLDRETKGGLFIWNMDSVAVATGLPETARILDYAIAPDRSRIALVVNEGATTTLRLGMIQRADDGTRIVGLTRIESRLAALTAVTWESVSTLVVLGSAGGAAVQPIRVSLPLGTITLLGGPANAVSLTAALGMPIVVGDQAGQLWEYRDNRWQASVLGDAPNYVI